MNFELSDKTIGVASVIGGVATAAYYICKTAPKARNTNEALGISIDGIGYGILGSASTLVITSNMSIFLPLGLITVPMGALGVLVYKIQQNKLEKELQQSKLEKEIQQSKSEKEH